MTPERNRRKVRALVHLRSSLGLGIFLVAALQGCSFRTTTPSVRTRIECERSSQCPTGLVCHRRLSQCAKAGDIDDLAPTLTLAAASLSARAGERVTAPSRLGPRTQFTFTVKASEDLAALSTQACAQATCVVTNVAPPFYDVACEATPGAAPFEGPCPVAATGVDLQQNASALAIDDSLSFDSVSPEPLDTETPRKVVFTRAPWGSSETGPQASYRLAWSGAETDSTVLVSGSSDVSGSLIATAAASMSPLELTATSPARLFVTVEDGAGNLSTTRSVRDVAVWATLGAPAGSPDNPHRLEASPILSGGYIRQDAFSLGQEHGVERDDGRSYLTTGAGTWVPRGTYLSPMAYRSASAWDEGRARGFVYGGFRGGDGGFSHPVNTVYEWTGIDWTLKVPTDPEGDANPPALIDAAAAYDARSRGIVVFGGLREDRTATQDTWLWNGKSWRKMFPATSPSARSGHAMSWDPRREAIVLTGGRDGTGALLSDMWTWSTQGWVRLPTVLPSARANHKTTFDGLRRDLVLTGGEGPLGRVWDAWRLRDSGWEPDIALGAGPLARSEHGFSFDTAHDVFWVLGGTVVDGGASGESLAFVDGGWTLVRTDFPTVYDAGYQVRSGLVTFYDPTRAETVFLGGTLPTREEGFPQLWRAHEASRTHVLSLDGGVVERWAVTFAFFAPSPRVNHAQAYDPDRGMTVIHGGEYGTAVFSDTSIWTGSQFFPWNAFPLLDGGTHRSPGFRTLHAMAYDRIRHRMVMVGGTNEPDSTIVNADSGTFVMFDAGTWVGTPETGWERIELPTPPARFLHTMYWNPIRGRIEMAGGSTFLTGSRPYFLNGVTALHTDIWSLGTTWEKEANAGSTQTGVAGVVDERRGKTILWPGYLNLGIVVLGGDALYLRDAGSAGNFAVLRPSEMPKPRVVENLLYDTQAQRVLTYGTSSNTRETYNSDRIWEFIDGRWNERSNGDPDGVGSPGQRAGFRFTYDERRGRGVLYGSVSGDLWEYDLAHRRPGHVLSVDLTASAPLSGARLTDMEVSAAAIGDSSVLLPDGGWTRSPGVALLAWSNGTWVTVATKSTAGGSTANLLHPMSKQQLERMLDGSGRAHWALAPIGVNGDGIATIATDVIETKLWFNAP